MIKKAIRSYSFSALLIFGVMISFTMTSCAEVASFLVEDSLQQGLQNNKYMKNSHPSAKAQEKEAERGDAETVPDEQEGEIKAQDAHFVADFLGHHVAAEDKHLLSLDGRKCLDKGA